MSVQSKWRVGAILYVQASVITSDAEIARRYGADSDRMFIPGTVLRCITKLSINGRNLKYVEGRWFLGGGGVKTLTVSISSTKIEPPEGAVLPEEVPELGISLASRPPAVPRATGISGGAGDLTFSQEFDLPSDADLAALPLPTAGTGARRVSLDCMAHETNWVEDDGAMNIDVNGVVAGRRWYIRDHFGNSYCKGSDPSARESRLDYFLLLFPHKALIHIVEETSASLLADGCQPTTVEEVIAFFGVVILATRFEFGSRASLWSENAYSRFHPAPHFGRTGIGRRRFDDIWSNLRFSVQPDIRPEDVSSEEYRWMMVNDFVKFFNEHRHEQFIPSDRICVDESMSRWYGMGGDWINAGLPMYIAIDRKPDNGAEIQNACCADSGVMLRLRIVKSKRAEANSSPGLDHSVGHGTAVLKELVAPWARTGRVVAADSYFASVEAARELFKIGLRFVGVVKTATKQYPMDALSRVQFASRGMWKGLLHKGQGDDPDILAFCWVDTNRRYFVSTVSSLAPAVPISRSRLRQVNLAPNADAERVQLLIDQPKASALYYSAAAKIDQHNRSRQADLGIERKLKTLDWSKRLNLSIFSMIVVDAMLVYKSSTLSEETPNVFFHKLAEEMIDYQLTTRQQRAAAVEVAEAVYGNSGRRGRGDNRRPVESGLGPHLTPTKRLRTPTSSGSTNKVSRARQQGRCKTCKDKKSVWICSTCRAAGRESFLCHTKDRESCWNAHMEDEHL